MKSQTASDLHLNVSSPPRLRIDGQIVPLDLPALSSSDCQELCYAVMTEQQKKELEENREVDFSFNVKNIARFRANIYFHNATVSGAFRIITDRIYSIEELGLPPVLEDICKLPNGLVLVTGPTGSGKSTTLASMIDYINSKAFGHILTIEDPIEFVHPHKNSIVSQREVGSDTMSFSRALKSALRQDPDVVLLGEMRDLETIHAAITIAETGHLVFATLHTNSCISSINRMIDVFPAHQQSQIRVQLSMTMKAVLSQILLPARGGGRVMAMEIMRVTPPIRALISEGKISQIYSSMQVGQTETKMQTMNQCLLDLVNKNYISRELAVEKSPAPEELAEMLLNKVRKR